MIDEKVLFLLDIDKIQDYIFATNKLKTIIGASWILDNINASPNGETIKLLRQDPMYGFNEGNFTDNDKFILSGGGNTKLIFEPNGGNNACRLAENFEAQITSAYRKMGVSVTTHIEPIMETDKTGMQALAAAEKAIARKKYNKKVKASMAASPFFKICGGCGRAYAEGESGPSEEKDVLCGICLTKMKRAKKNFRLLPELKFETDAGKMRGQMLAVVVMDGNKMGEKIKALQSLEALKDFSRKMELFQAEAFKDCLQKYFGEQYSEKMFNSVRPVIMGGDDICFVIDAKHALQFVTEFISVLENKSEPNEQNAEPLRGVGRITVSAGILFIKKNYPFNFAHHIAESLLRSAKKTSRMQGDCSVIDFHVILSSAGDDIEKTRLREYLVEQTRLLTNRPYKLSDISNIEGNGLLKDVRTLKKILPANKIKFLRQVLRLDLETGTREILKILTRLKMDEAEKFCHLLKKYGWEKNDEGIWHTGLLDLVELTEFSGQGNCPL
jgi:hypothetical protein